MDGDIENMTIYEQFLINCYHVSKAFVDRFNEYSTGQNDMRVFTVAMNPQILFSKDQKHNIRLVQHYADNFTGDVFIKILIKNILLENVNLDKTNRDHLKSIASYATNSAQMVQLGKDADEQIGQMKMVVEKVGICSIYCLANTTCQVGIFFLLVF